ncbi:autophagy-related protein 16-1 isoform X2 [Phlebotomus papatasi]|uniref:autophagy-related protein 16-1 isoform X2 n=1 Tax=Phlebotomus papatasi TaxID=29031 RepID=UPI00248345C8|nr:autophagy-related protein 16-1 isoform X2 [Phlebotomus papatasi]
MNIEEPMWKKKLLQSLKERNRKETSFFDSIFAANNRLFDSNVQLQMENLRLSVDNEQLRSGAGHSASSGSAASSSKIQALEKKLMTQQEELTELHKRKGENAQMIVDLNVKLAEMTKKAQDREEKYTEQVTLNGSLKAEVQMLSNNISELKGLNTILRDEYTALQLALSSLEDKLRKVQDENRQLVDRLMKYKAKDADKLNEENENLLRKRTEKMRRELEDAAQDASRRSSSPILPLDRGDRGSLADLSGAGAKAAGFFSVSLPTSVHLKFDAHDGEVNAVRWCPLDRIIATGGADRKVKLWDVGTGTMEPRGTLVGSNAGVNSVDFDSTGTMILGTSNDFASRVWTVADQRLRHTLTGHCGKVMAAKFLSEHTRVVTGSHDRTLKVWDLRNRACVETKFAGSSCNDLVTTDGSGSCIISGHFDKKIRFWDTRTDSSSNDIVLSGRVASLDLSRDCRYLLSCVRDDTIKLLDLRMSHVVKSFSHDGFKVGCDWSRVSLSSDGTYIAAGSADGAVYVWNVAGRLETILKDHSNGAFFGRSAVTATSWHPFSSVLATVDRSKKCTIWTDA